DAVTLRGDDFKAVAVATCIVGSGKYAAREIGPETPREVPLFLFGGADEFFTQHFGQTLDEAIGSCDLNVLADVLDSAAIGSPAMRDGYDKIMNRLALKEREAWRDEYHDRERSSLNDIC